MLCSIATKLGEAELGEIKSLEQDIGRTVLAFSCHQVDPASLDEAQLSKLRELEEKLGVSLVAVAA
jgi:hypothetical protein